MGDRTFAQITLTKAGYKKLEEIYKEQGKQPVEEEHGCEIEEYGGNINITDGEANYADIGVEETLQKHKIEYDKCWEQGGEYEAGEEYARIVKGKYVVHERSLEDERLLNELKHILEEKDIKKAISKKIKKLEPFVVEPLDRSNAEKFIEMIK